MHEAPLSGPLPDKDIIEQIIAGDIDLYEVLVRRYNSYLFRIGRSNGYTPEDTQDLMQEAYLQAYRHLKTFEHRSSFKTWLVSIFVNQCYQFRHRSQYQHEIPSEIAVHLNHEPMFTSRPIPPDHMTANKELQYVLETAIQQLQEEYRMVFTLRELGGLSTAETAATLEITESNVKVRLTRAKSMLRAALTKMYSPGELFEFNLIYCDRMVERVMMGIRHETGV